jgi:hypothetical protein
MIKKSNKKITDEAVSGFFIVIFNVILLTDNKDVAWGVFDDVVCD